MAPGGPRLSRSHDLLAERFRVIVFEAPGFGRSAANSRSETMRDLAGTMIEAVANLGIERYSLQGTSFGGRLACWMAVQAAERIDALVLSAPGGDPTGGLHRPGGDAQQMARLLYAYPERRIPAPPADPEVLDKQNFLVNRLIGPNRDADLERGSASFRSPRWCCSGPRIG